MTATTTSLRDVSAEFPVLGRRIDGHRLVYLDSSATSQTPQPVIDASAALAWFDTEHACLLAAQHAATTHAWHFTVWWLAWSLNTFHLRRGHRHDRLIVWQAAADAATHLPDPTTHARTHQYLGRAQPSFSPNTTTIPPNKPKPTTRSRGPGSDTGTTSRP